jgi:hypothetical protein
MPYNCGYKATKMDYDKVHQKYNNTFGFCVDRPYENKTVCTKKDGKTICVESDKSTCDRIPNNKKYKC